LPILNLREGQKFEDSTPCKEIEKGAAWAERGRETDFFGRLIDFPTLRF
jgi:hypothetical protein